MIIRLAQPGDIDSLLELAAMIPAGMTSMPGDRTTWETKLERVAQSVADELTGDDEAVYLLVLEEPDTGKVVGTAGIVAGVGLNRPFYNYRLSKEVKASEDLDIRSVSNLLNLNNDYTGATELVSLFLRPEYRHRGVGQLLSRCRYMFMADFPERFSDLVFAEIRGWLDEDNDSPFWRHLGQKFFNLPFQKADFISAVSGTQFISDLMPRFPVYLELLPAEARDVVGKPHREAEAAMGMLGKEGFSYKGSIDIFDGGPVVECERDNIESIKQILQVRVAEVSDSPGADAESSPDQAAYMVSNRDLAHYRIVTTPLEMVSPDAKHEPGSATDFLLPAAAAKLLGVAPGAQLHALKMR